jgi:hypothetical protein
VGCDGLYADRVCKDCGGSARSHKVDHIESFVFPLESRGFATWWLFQLRFVGVARNGLGRRSVKGCMRQSGVVLKEGG